MKYKLADGRSVRPSLVVLDDPQAWQQSEGTRLKIERCLIDANWALSTDVVYQFCRACQHSQFLIPSHGRYVGAASSPFSQYRNQPGDKAGHKTGAFPPPKHVIFDTNYWMSFVHARLAVPSGENGCLSLFGEKPESHRQFADHPLAEYRIKTEGRGRKVDEWRARPSGGDNHLLDCLVGRAVAASMQGCRCSNALRSNDQGRRPSNCRIYRNERWRRWDTGTDATAGGSIPDRVPEASIGPRRTGADKSRRSPQGIGTPCRPTPICTHQASRRRFRSDKTVNANGRGRRQSAYTTRACLGSASPSGPKLLRSAEVRSSADQFR